MPLTCKWRKLKTFESQENAHQVGEICWSDEVPVWGIYWTLPFYWIVQKNLLLESAVLKVSRSKHLSTKISQTNACNSDTWRK